MGLAKLSLKPAGAGKAHTARYVHDFKSLNHIQLMNKEKEISKSTDNPAKVHTNQSHKITKK